MMITRYPIGLCREYNPFTPCAARPDVVSILVKKDFVVAVADRTAVLVKNILYAPRRPSDVPSGKVDGLQPTVNLECCGDSRRCAQ